MKKLTLRALALGAKEVLTREQVKSIMGGRSAGGGDHCADSFAGFDDGDASCDGSGPGGAGKKYKCCPAGKPNSSLCSECVDAPAGTTATCLVGVVTSC